MRDARWAVVAMLALVLGAGLAAGYGGENGPVVMTKSDCYRCHAQSSPPLRTMAQLLPPGGVSVKLGSSVPYSVPVQNAWDGELRATIPVLDLSHAPSVAFSPDAGDYSISNESAIPLPPNTNDPTQYESVTIPVVIPAGESSFALTVTPTDQSPTGPALRLEIPAVGSKAAQTVDAPGPGQTFGVSYGPPDAHAVAGQLLEVKVEARRVDPNATPPRVLTVTSVPFTLDVQAKFDLAGLTQLAQPILTPLAAHTSGIVSWPLKAMKAPGADEYLLLWVNSTAYYHHNAREGPGPTDSKNWNNFTEPDGPGLDAFTPLKIAVTSDGDNLLFKPETTTIVRPQVTNGATMITVGEAVGYASTFLIVSSIYSGGMFGKASRRSLNGVFGSAKRRVAFHNVLSYGIILAAAVHMVLFLIEPLFDITLGAIWGGLAILAMFGLGITGAMQVPMIRRWSYGVWRWTHYGMTIAVIVFTIVHMLLDGTHFGSVQTALHWSNPFPTKSTA